MDTTETMAAIELEIQDLEELSDRLRHQGNYTDSDEVDEEIARLNDELDEGCKSDLMSALRLTLADFHQLIERARSLRKMIS